MSWLLFLQITFIYYLDIKGGGTGGVSVVEGAHAVEGSAVHHAQDDGETGNQEHL